MTRLHSKLHPKIIFLLLFQAFFLVTNISVGSYTQLDTLIGSEDDSSAIINTLVGNARSGFSGDGDIASKAMLNGPNSVAVDKVGNLYITDSFNQRIRKVDALTNIITTVAGSGRFGFSGDGGLAIDASLRTSNGGGIAIDSKGNLFISDTGNNRVRRVDALTGIITTVAGSDNIQISDGELATKAGLSKPQGICIDSLDNLFIADFFHELVRKVDAKTGIITTVAGSRGGFGGDGGLATNAFLLNPIAVSVDNNGNLFISDFSNKRIRRVDGKTKIITTFAGTGSQSFTGDGGLATQAGINFPYELCVDSSNNLYITDSGNSAIRKVDVTTGIIRTVVGVGSFGYSGDGGLATKARLNSPHSVVFDSLGNLYIADYSNNAIRVVKNIDFTLNFNPSELTVSRGQSGVFRININRTGGFTDNVTINSPDTKILKIKLTPLTQSTTGFSVDFNFKIKKKASIGTQQLIFTGQDDKGRVRTALLTLTIKNK